MFRVYMRIKDASYEVVNEGYFDDQKFFGPENELITQLIINYMKDSLSVILKKYA